MFVLCLHRLVAVELAHVGSPSAEKERLCHTITSTLVEPYPGAKRANLLEVGALT